MIRRAPAGLAVCLTLIGTLMCTADEAQAQFGWSFRLGPWQSSYYFGRATPSYYTGYYPSYSRYYAGYSPSYTSYYAGYAPSYAYTASYAPLYTASYYAPSCVSCASPCVTCGVSPCACQPCTGCAAGCTPTAVTAGTAGAVAGAPPAATPPGMPTTCRKCTIDDAQVYSGPQGLMYIDGERGFVQMEWGGRLRYAELTFRRQDDDFRYYEQLPPPGEEPIARPPMWSVALRPCSQCKHAIWHNYDQTGARGWTKVESAEVRCVTPLAPPSTSPNAAPNTPPNTEERRRPPYQQPPYQQEDGFELERREKQTDRNRDAGWTIVPQRRAEGRTGNLAWVSAESDPLPALSLSETVSKTRTTRRTTATPQRLAGNRESTLRISRAERLRD